MSIKIYEWSNGLVNHMDLLFPDLAKSVNDKTVELENWEGNERRNKKHKFYDLRNIRNGEYIEMRHDDEECGNNLSFLIFDETIKCF